MVKQQTLACSQRVHEEAMHTLENRYVPQQGPAFAHTGFVHCSGIEDL